MPYICGDHQQPAHSTNGSSHISQVGHTNQSSGLDVPNIYRVPTHIFTTSIENVKATKNFHKRTNFSKIS